MEWLLGRFMRLLLATGFLLFGRALNVSRLQETIHRGRVYQIEDFVSETEVQELLDGMQGLDFQASGLSNTVVKEQNFGSQDRRTCPVPWWKDSLESTHETEVSRKLQDLRQTLADALDRPTMKDASLAHECYYSVGGVGSFLPRHMDERHEELKGPKGWILPSRRSLSWLIYLSDADWSLEENGGALRAFTPRNASSASQHDGNLQVGWLLGGEPAQPVFMDSWFGDPLDPQCVLYTVVDNERVFVTRAWLNTALQSVSVPDFLAAWAEKDAFAKEPVFFASSEVASSFVLLEDRSAWDRGQDPEGSVIQDVAPLRGSLVIFDSVVVPHQVERVVKGQRVAVAGWFHERTQSFPELFA